MIREKKCKSNLQEAITSHIEWCSSERREGSVGEDVQKRESLHMAGGNVSWCGHYGKWYGVSLKKQNKTEKRTTIQSCNPTFLGIYPKETKTRSWRSAFSSSVQHYLQQSRHEKQVKCSSPDKEGYTVGMYTQQNIIQPWERRKSCHLQQPGWTLRALC